MRHGLVLSLVVVAIAASSALAQSKSAPMPARVVCFGDSITKQGYPELVGKALGVTVANAGVGGQNTAQGLRRIQADVVARKPEVVVVLFGTNDSRLAEAGAHVPVADYEKNLQTIIDTCTKAGAKVVICTLPPIDPEPYFTRHKKEPFEAAGGLPKVVGEYRAAAIRAAESRKCAVIDLHALLSKEEQATWLSKDGVHPTEKGKQFIADRVAETIKPMLAK